MTNPECYLKFESWGESATITKDHSDITIDDFFMMCRQIATMKFGEANAEALFGEF